MDDFLSRLRGLAGQYSTHHGSADLIRQAADRIEQTAGQKDALLKSMEALRDAHLAEHEAAGRAEAARRRFLEQAVCHPGPPMSETEDYTGEEDLGELEAIVLERLDRELRLENDLGTIWRLTEEAMGGTLGLGRNTSADPLAAVRLLLDELAGIVNSAVSTRYQAHAHHEIAIPLVERVRREIGRGLRALPSREPAAPELSVRTSASSTKQGLFRKYKVCRWDGMCDSADSEYFVLRLPAAPGSPEQHALAAYADAVECTHPKLASDMRERYQLRGPVAVDNGQRDAVAEHIRAAGGNPEAATVAQIADALNATSEGVKFTVNAAGDGVNFEVDQKSRVRSIKVVGGDRVADLGLAPPAVKLQWDSPDTFEVAPPKRITIDLRRPATPPTPAEEVENAVYMARMMEGVKQAGAARPEWPLMPLEIVMQIGFATFKPEATSVIWAGQVISTGDADLSLQMENPVHELSVFNFEDSMGRVRKQSGKGRMWLALDDAAAERLGFYCGAGLDGPVSLTLLWPSSDAMRFEVRLHGDALDDDEGMPKTRAGDGKAWHGYQIEVCPYPGPAADLFQARNRP